MERFLTRIAVVGTALVILCWPAVAGAGDKVVSLSSEPFQKHVGNLERFDTVELTTVPDGKRLVIECINAFESVGGAFDFLNINTSDDEGGVVLAFPFLNAYVDTHPRIIVGPGRTVSARNFGSADATLTVSGHYEPVPPAQ